MIIRINPKDCHVLANFLQSAKHAIPTMPKSFKSKLSRLEGDFRSGQVNSQRFEAVFPVVKLVHRTMRNIVASTAKYSRIRRWKRLLVLPAVFDYLVFVLPWRIRNERRLNRIADVLLTVEAQIKGGGSPRTFLGG